MALGRRGGGWRRSCGVACRWAHVTRGRGKGELLQRGPLRCCLMAPRRLSDAPLPFPSWLVCCSNWLLMYLGDAEVQQLARNMLNWVRAPPARLTLAYSLKFPHISCVLPVWQQRQRWSARLQQWTAVGAAALLLLLLPPATVAAAVAAAVLGLSWISTLAGGRGWHCVVLEWSLCLSLVSAFLL